MSHKRQTAAAEWVAALATGGVTLLGLALLGAQVGRGAHRQPRQADGDKGHSPESGARQGKILVKRRRFIGPDELARARAEQRTAHNRLGETLIDLGLITEGQLAEALIEQKKPTDPWRDAVG